MKIKTKLRLTAIGLTGIAMIVSLFLFYMTRRIDESLARGELARQIVKGTFELSLMTHDFLLHHSERAVKQWRLKHESLSNLISPGMFGEENEKVIIEKRILQNHKAAGILFDQVVADYTRRRANRQDRTTTCNEDPYDVEQCFSFETEERPGNSLCKAKSIHLYHQFRHPNGDTCCINVLPFE
jgi:hypothetical protein